MQRLKEEFLEKVEKVVPLSGLSVLEIGCGDGSRSVGIAERCEILTAIEPNEQKIKLAQARKISNAIFEVGSGDNLPYDNESFDAVIFTLSLHHIPVGKMKMAINEAVRVAHKTGYIIFLEPTETGTFFAAEIKFDAGDGDERKGKVMAYRVMLNHERMRSVCEIDDETIFQFQSDDDFVDSIGAKKNLGQLKNFLEFNHYILKAGRRINIFQPK